MSDMLGPMPPLYGEMTVTKDEHGFIYSMNLDVPPVMVERSNATFLLDLWHGRRDEAGWPMRDSAAEAEDG